MAPVLVMGVTGMKTPAKILAAIMHPLSNLKDPGINWADAADNAEDVGKVIDLKIVYKEP